MVKLSDSKLEANARQILEQNGYQTVESVMALNSNDLVFMNGSDVGFVYSVLNFQDQYRINPSSLIQVSTETPLINNKTLSLIKATLTDLKIASCDYLISTLKSDVAQYSPAKLFNLLKKELSSRDYCFSEDSKEFVVSLTGYEPTRLGLMELLISDNHSNPVGLSVAATRVGLTEFTLKNYIERGVFPGILIFDDTFICSDENIVFDSKTVVPLKEYALRLGSAGIQVDEAISILARGFSSLDITDLSYSSKTRVVLKALAQAGCSGYYFDQPFDVIRPKVTQKKKWFFD